MSYHHLALATKDMDKTHEFYEGVMGFELVKVEIAPIPGGGWGKHFFYRMNGDDTKFIAFWELHDTSKQDELVFDMNKAGNLPDGTFHFSFNVESVDELNAWRERWNSAGHDVLELDHNWCHSVYTKDPDNNFVEFCLTSGEFTDEDRNRAIEALTETEMNPSPPPAKMKVWPSLKAQQTAAE
ncbi:MAG: VOC family protein [Pseudomonadota bacterium]